MACGMSDRDWEYFENYNPTAEPVDSKIEEARRILSGNAGWYTQAQIAWAMEQC